jgi:glycosyltransferase involved in cell wall biosynthesis
LSGGGMHGPGFYADEGGKRWASIRRIGMNRPRVLLVTYLFPPCGGVPVQRALGIARHLPAAGVDLHVLTARNPISAHGADPSLLEKVPSEVTVHHAAAWEPPGVLRNWAKRFARGGPDPSGVPAGPPPGWKRLVKMAAERAAFPDPQARWAKAGINAAAKLIERNQIGHVVLTVPPFSLLAAARGLRSRFPRLRIVLDFRDEWLAYHLPEFEVGASPWKRQRAAQLEAEAVCAADVVVTVTESWVEGFRRRYPSEAHRKFVYSPNGFDAEMLPGSASATRASAPPLLIGYMGTVYANPVYSPASFLDALDAMPGDWRDRVEMRFFGRVAPDAERLFENRLTRILRTGFLPQREAFERLSGCHGLLLIVGNATVHSAKLFEYLAMGIPVLAITPPEGEVGRLIRELRAGWSVRADDCEGIQSALRELYAAATGETELPQRHEAAIARFDRRNLVPEMARACGLLGG